MNMCVIVIITIDTVIMIIIIIITTSIINQLSLLLLLLLLLLFVSFLILSSVCSASFWWDGETAKVICFRNSSAELAHLGSELHKEGHMTTGYRLFRKEFLRFETMPCRQKPLPVHFWLAFAESDGGGRRTACLRAALSAHEKPYRCLRKNILLGEQHNPQRQRLLTQEKPGGKRESDMQRPGGA